ncbi:MAG: glycosyltransferase [Pirellulaceae bacterium]
MQALAIVLQTASTGGWRYVRQLVAGLRAVAPELNITCYLGAQVQQVFADERPEDCLRMLGAEVRTWVDPDFVRGPSQRRGLSRFVDEVKTKRKRRQARRLHAHLIDELNTFDLVFFAWPYFLDCPPLQTQMAFIPHDFNYTHFMGSFITSARNLCRTAPTTRGLASREPGPWSLRISLLEKLSEYSQRWTAFQKSSTCRVWDPTRPLRQVVARVVSELGLAGRYLLNLNNITPHKNLGQVLAGFYYCLDEHPDLKLVIAGYGTDGIRGRANGPNFIDNCEDDWNVISLGLLTDEQVTALIQQAEMVVNASLYEAGNGSGLDAWALGTPVVMSQIPPFVEQMEFLGTEAQTFSPRCCYQIRDAMTAILNQPESTREMVDRSQAAMARYTWHQVATQYVEFFRRISG